MHLVAKDAEAGGPTGTNRPFGDYASFKAVPCNDRRLLNDVAPFRRDHLKGGVVEITGRALLEPRSDSLIDLSVQAHKVPTHPQDADAHTVVSMPTDPVDFKLLVEPGKSAKLTFSQPGIYGYYCDAHSDYDRTTGLIKAKKGADAYPISMYGVILVAGDTLPLAAGKAKIVMPSADRFEPLLIAVRQGTQVTWTNLDGDAHTVLTDPGVSIQLKFVVPANGHASYTFDKAGIYPYFCDAHATWNSELKRVQARLGSSEYPAAMEGVVFVLP